MSIKIKEKISRCDGRSMLSYNDFTNSMFTIKNIQIKHFENKKTNLKLLKNKT